MYGWPLKLILMSQYWLLIYWIAGEEAETVKKTGELTAHIVKLYKIGLIKKCQYTNIVASYRDTSRTLHVLIWIAHC